MHVLNHSSCHPQVFCGYLHSIVARARQYVTLAMVSTVLSCHFGKRKCIRKAKPNRTEQKHVRVLQLKRPQTYSNVSCSACEAAVHELTSKTVVAGTLPRISRCRLPFPSTCSTTRTVPYFRFQRTFAVAKIGTSDYLIAAYIDNTPKPET